MENFWEIAKAVILIIAAWWSMPFIVIFVIVVLVFVLAFIIITIERISNYFSFYEKDLRRKRKEFKRKQRERKKEKLPF